MANSIFERKTLTDTLRFPPPVVPAPNVKATVLKVSPVAAPISQLAARRRPKQMPPLNIATFATTSSLAQPHGQFRVHRHSPLAPAHQAIQSAHAEQQDWAALVIEQAASMPAPLAGWLEQLACPSPTAKAIAYTDAVQARAKQDMYRDATMIPGPIVPFRPAAARQSLPAFIKRTASAPEAFRAPAPTIDRRRS